MVSSYGSWVMGGKLAKGWKLIRSLGISGWTIKLQQNQGIWWTSEIADANDENLNFIKCFYKNLLIIVSVSTSM